MPDEILNVLLECARSIESVVHSGEHRGFSGVRETQYHLDVVADSVAVEFLADAGFRVVSEESGVSGSGEVTVVVDPVDGSTNCDHGIPFFATSLAAVQEGELIAGVVKNLATGTTYQASRGGGAQRDGVTLSVSKTTRLSDAVMSFSGLPDGHWGWAQFRALGAASLEVCLVADGSLDLFGVASRSALHPWDYLAGLLILEEAGGVGVDIDGRALLSVERTHRRPIFASNEELLTRFRERANL